MASERYIETESTPCGDVCAPLHRGLRQSRDRAVDEDFTRRGGHHSLSYPQAIAERLQIPNGGAGKMTNDKKTPISKTLDDAIQAMRSDEARESIVRAAGDRVWSKISGESDSLQLERIGGCADVQSLSAAYSDDE